MGHLEGNMGGHVLDAAVSDVESVSALPGGWGVGLVHQKGRGCKYGGNSFT